MKGNTRGVTFPKGGYTFKNVLPHLSGFSDFCFRLYGADLGSFQLKVCAAGAQKQTRTRLLVAPHMWRRMHAHGSLCMLWAAECAGSER